MRRCDLVGKCDTRPGYSCSMVLSLFPGTLSSTSYNYPFDCCYISWTEDGSRINMAYWDRFEQCGANISCCGYYHTICLGRAGCKSL
eukprot:scaffold1028_cov135-Cylindrotheca_fusiformis.AAC.4